MSNGTIDAVNQTVSSGWLHFHNFMSGVGFDGGAFSSDWYFAWIMMALLVVIGMIASKWLGEENITGHEYNAVWGYLGGLLPYFIFVSLTGLYKIGFLIGLVCMIAAGIFMANYGFTE